jgi:site-specific recombinase XerC
LSRSAAEKMIRTLLRRIAEGDMETLSTHSLRKSWARRLYEVSGHDLITVKEGLGHSSVSVSQRYLACDRGRLDELILKGDWTRPRPQQRAPHLVISEGSSHPRQAAAFIETTPFLPGFGEISAA